MGTWCLCWHNLMSMQSYLCCEMLPGLCQFFSGASHSLHFSRQSQLCQLLSDLPIQMMRKSLQMLAGPCRISQMVLMTKSKHLLHPSPAVLIPALRTVGNIVTGDDMQTQCIIGHQALPCLLNLLTNNYKKSIKKEACWTISNITAGNVDQIQAVIEAGIISPLVHLLQNAEFEIKKEAAWAISNATSGGTHEQIKYISVAITVLWVL